MTDALRILYVDDEQDIRTIALMALELDPGLTVRSAGSGPEALSMIETDSWRPDVMLLDVMMPEMDGPTLFRTLRERPDFASAPVIFMTAKARGDDIAAYLADGAIGVVTKPFDPMVLAGQVRALLKSASKP